MPKTLLVHAALVVVALSLRMTSDSGEASNRSETGEVQNEANQHVAKHNVFASLWARRYETETHLHDPMNSSIKLVLGLFTVAPDVAYRQIVRETWLNQTGVCYWFTKPPDRCTVFVAFVIGKSGEGDPPRNGSVASVSGARVAGMTAEQVERTHKEKGMIVLPVPENLNSNKTQVWFEKARQMFPWATHIGKIDIDTYPYLHKLVHRLEAGMKCSLRRSPYEIIGRPHDSNGPRFTHLCQSHSRGCTQTQFVSEQDTRWPIAQPGKPWRFLSGEFYALSMPLVQRINWTSQVHGATEDLQMTRRVSIAAEEHRFCVVLRRPDAWYHRSARCEASFANDFEGNASNWFPE